MRNRHTGPSGLAHDSIARFRLVILWLSLGAGASTAAAGEKQGSVLASYSFDDDVPTGPDTFRIFQYSKGTVRLTSAYHVSGYRAIELRDVAGDQSMPEIQGYFPLQVAGRLHAHFSFLTATPREELNIALAGPRSFQLEKDGIGFWLKSEHGTLVHYTGGVAKKLFALEPFVWYSVTRLRRGRGDLRPEHSPEGQNAPLVSLLQQKNAPGRPRSTIDKFSFVGSPWVDTSNVVYYVDDIVIGTSAPLAQRPFVAPGRRKLFVDAFTEYQARESARPRCLPAEPEDFGFTTQDTAELRWRGPWRSSPSSPPASPYRFPRFPKRLPARLAEGSTPPGNGAGGARPSTRGSPKPPWRSSTRRRSRLRGRIYGLSRALALVALGRVGGSRRAAGPWRSRGESDARYAVASAMAGTARGDLDRAEEWLRDPAEAAVARGGSPSCGSSARGGPHRSCAGRVEAGLPPRLAGAPERHPGVGAVFLRPALAPPAERPRALRCA